MHAPALNASPAMISVPIVSVPVLSQAENTYVEVLNCVIGSMKHDTNVRGGQWKTLEVVTTESAPRLRKTIACIRARLTFVLRALSSLVVLPCIALGQTTLAPTDESLVPPDSMLGYKLSSRTVIGHDTYFGYSGPAVTALTLRIASETSGWRPDAASVAPALAKRVGAFIHDIDVERSQGALEDYRLAFESAKAVHLQGKTIPRQMAAVALTRKGRKYLSFFYVYWLRSQVLEIRVTIPASSWLTSQALEFPSRVVEILATPSHGSAQ